MEPFQELEVKFAEWNSLDPVGMVACSSGTAALHLALEAFQLPLGSEVIIPDLTMVACPRAVMLAEHYPQFVDCNNQLLMDDHILNTAHWLSNARAVMAVHTYGRQVNLDQFPKVRRCWFQIEDLAEAHGVRPHKHTDAACWSFYKNKIIAGEEGGAVWFKNPEHAKLARQLRSLGFTDEHDFTHIPRGHNYRMSNAHAKLVLPSLTEADVNLAKRRQVEQWYNEKVPQEWQMPARDVVWVYDLRIPGMTSEQQNSLVKGLNQKGIAARHCFKPMTTMQEWQGRQPVSPNALRLSREIIYLPASPWFTEWDVTKIIDALIEVQSGL